jgi:hypothetical protein
MGLMQTRGCTDETSATEEARRVGGNDALGFDDILKRQASICDKLISDCVGTAEQMHKASLGSAAAPY